MSRIVARCRPLLFFIAVLALSVASAFAGMEEDDTGASAPRGFGTTPPLPAGTSMFLAICYHAVEDVDPDQSYNAVSTAKLVQQFSWLERNGYHPVSIDQLVAARDRGVPLPANPVLLTFDDGYESFYTRAFPILKAFKFPAVLGLVHSWMAGAPKSEVEYGSSMAMMPRSFFMTWDQVREVQRSGLVEIASHSNNLHLGIPANPQGNLEPAAVTRRYDSSRGSYETESAYEDRIKADAAGISGEIFRQTGKQPRAMIWPYGEHSELAISIYGSAGMPITMNLIDGVGALDKLQDTPRHLVKDDPQLADFVADMHHLVHHGPTRVVHVDLDYVYDPDPAQQDKNLGAVVQRVYDLGVSIVFLQAYADPDGNGLAKSVYFPNKLLPMRADLFNRAAWQLRTRAGVRVYAWLPVLSFAFGQELSHVLAWNSERNEAAPDPAQPVRLSPFDPTARALIGQLYEEMAASTPIAGILFSDDAILTDFEDASPEALEAYRTAGLPGSVAAIRADPFAMEAWTRLKTRVLIDFTKELAARVRIHRAPLSTARNIFARPILEPTSQAWFAQDLDSFLATYDYTAIMAMPLMEDVAKGDAEAWLDRLRGIVAKRPGGLSRSIFELQAVDWRVPESGPDREVPTETLAREMRLLARQGALNFGYYPDDAPANHPDVKELRKTISLAVYPYRP
ncbi:MAG TPA: poly-beta-1,6-N-acetyl-D-glucosamine N-deacetylase PgaB [Alphaproteobacteria bacterium]|nr:poly-beta-1,6-N-acetyl-D-glucosamine N-deacetylase PgaB [Alphaproteobacteria bacterium]